MAVLIVAHDVNPILAYLDRVVYLGPGGAVSGAPEEVITTETLTRLYQAPIEVLHASDGRLVVVGQPEAPSYHPASAPLARTSHWNRRWTRSLHVPLHGERVPGRHRGRGGGRGRRLVHGAASADVRRAHALGRRLSRRGGRGAGSASSATLGFFAFCSARALLIAGDSAHDRAGATARSRR